MCLTECLTETIFANVWAKTLPRKARSPLSVTFVAQKRLCLSSLFRNEGGGGGGGGGCLWNLVFHRNHVVQTVMSRK